MRIAIIGAGIAGPAAAYWLKEWGHEPVLFEKAPAIRTGGYVIDFWGVGYDVAERMGILRTIHKEGYQVKELLDYRGDNTLQAELKLGKMFEYMDNRVVTLPRSSISRIILESLEGVDIRFNASITDILQNDNKVNITFSEGNTESFDLLIGADGIHSRVRELVFGKEEDFENDMGYHVAAFALNNYNRTDELTYVLHTVPRKQVARFTMKENKTLFLFVFESSLLNTNIQTVEQEKEALRQIYSDSTWEVPEILKRMDDVGEMYFDTVSQIKMKQWYKGRVVLIGDAAAAVSLLAGEGTGLAMLEAYILAGEVKVNAENYEKAFTNYEHKLKEFVTKKQKSAYRYAGFFAPKGKMNLLMRNLVVNLTKNNFFAKMFVNSEFKEEFTIPNY
jgi:2-polyprenyl-6-methoxyphenol hydroxylase-like FAD-dependent oxidoreductase